VWSSPKTQTKNHILVTAATWIWLFSLETADSTPPDYGHCNGEPLSPALAILNYVDHEHLFHKPLESNHRAIAPDFFSSDTWMISCRSSWMLTVILNMLIATSTLTDHHALRFIQFSMIFFVSPCGRNEKDHRTTHGHIQIP
jgi:hypothetical protein